MAKKNGTSKIILPNDFERMIPEYHRYTITYGEHIVRYVAAANLLKDKCVLDIACGSGYGTKILANEASEVIGVDVMPESVSYAQQNYSAKNIRYMVGDGVKIPLEDNSVDVVVSFETIEHIKNYRQFMKEVRRVLTKDGLLILSTPNELEFAEGNHFHLHEFTYKELKSLTEEYFANNISYFQGTWIYTALFKENEISEEFQAPIPTIQAAPLSTDKYLYFFMLCSNRKITERVMSQGVISEHWSAKDKQAKDQLTDDHINNLNEQMKAAKKYARHQEKTVKLKEDHIQNLEVEIKQIKNSKIWKLASRLKRSS